LGMEDYEKKHTDYQMRKLTKMADDLGVTIVISQPVTPGVS
jgi:hypothetical protein